MSTHKICFHGKIRKILILLVKKSALSKAIYMVLIFTITLLKV